MDGDEFFKLESMYAIILYDQNSMYCSISDESPFLVSRA